MADHDFPYLMNPGIVTEKLNPIGALKAQFDGVAQRGYQSINPVKSIFDITYPMLKIDDFVELYTFIKDKLSVVPFNWTNPINDIDYEMVCTDFSAGVRSGNLRYNVSLTIEEF